MAVLAGLFIGDIGVKYGMSEETKEYLNGFWSVIDQILATSNILGRMPPL